jgi:peptide-methionine (R)-S-oxide reductase
MQRITFLICAVAVLLLTARCVDTSAQKKPNPYYSRTSTAPVKLTDAQWKAILPADLYYIARKEGTDPAFSSRYHDNHARGIYYCAACGNALFSSDAKFESGTGWPSFYQPLNGSRSVTQRKDADGFRDEVRCARCDAHLGHVFDDGPKPTGLRYCMNGLSLKFLPDAGPA